MFKCRQVTIEPSNICSSNCIPCPRNDFLQKQGTLPMSILEKIVRELQGCEVDLIEFCGFGEPFLNIDFINQCKMIKKNLPNVKIYTVSNGGYIPNTKISNYIDAIKFSFYGMTKVTYEKVHRGNLKFEVTLKNILELLGNKKRPEIIMQYILLKENKHELESWISFWESIGVDEIVVWKPHNWLYNNYRIIDHYNQITCGRPFNGPPYIHVDGKVSVCCWDINKELIIGDITKQSFKEIYNSVEFKKIQEAHKLGLFSGYICDNCCQTNRDDTVLIYSSKNRRVGEISGTKTSL